MEDEKRGFWPYYLPISCNRYELAVSGKYDQGSNEWIKMFDDGSGSWVVAFHGVAQPDLEYEDTNVVNSIMSGLEKG